MPTLRPAVLTPGTSFVGVTLGGLVGTVGVLGLLYALPVLGVDAIDALHAIGGIATSHATAAFWIGGVIFMLGGVVAWPAATLTAWAVLPGANVGLAGAALKGVVVGVAVWVVGGLSLGVGSWLNRAAHPHLPGLFASNAGVAGAVFLFLGCVLYGLAVALIGAMEAGLSPLELLGWTDYYHAAAGPRLLGAHRSAPDDLLQELGGGV